MGQRSQIYIRYNKGENLFAWYLQWNYGGYMINRAHQILDFINDNLKKDDMFDPNSFSYFKRDINPALTSLTQLNLTISSFQLGCDISDEAENGVFNPFYADNNDGILVVDIIETQEGRKIKYCFDFLEDSFKPITAAQYYGDATNEESYYHSDIKYQNDKEYINTVLNQIKIIDTSFELLTPSECEKIFSKTYFN